jgi:aminoglycoside phosphotransferase (APT) family kinase protein
MIPMAVEPDGVEVVGSAAEASELELAPLLVLDNLVEYLDRRGLGAGRVSWARIGDGQSNVTYKITRGSDVFVLRRGPRPPFPASAHDMIREATVQQVLRQEGVATPEILDICTEPDVLGVPFYVMGWLDGAVITDRAPAELDSTEQRRRISTELVRALADLHAVDVARGDCATLGRPAGYLERQVRRFSSIWDQVATRSLPNVEVLASWLDENRPESQAVSVVHGDYRLGNLMFARTAPATTRAVLDWELATLGDPLADLGYLLATYSDSDGSKTPLHLSPATACPGYLSSDALVLEYAERSALDLSGLAWYRTLALWKAAIFCEAIYARWLKGERPGDTTFGPTLEVGVPALLAGAEQARRAL